MPDVPPDLMLVVTTLEEEGSACALARRLVDERLIACGNVLPGLHSIYRWQGRVEEAGEVMVLMKTRGELLLRLQERVMELHPYDVPEFIAVRASDVGQVYGAWVRDETTEVNG
mgnify:CR=1 FL=1